MPILKANEPLPERPVVIGYYGEPGVRKTSIAHTAETPLLLDFDRGVGRSYGRKDAILVDNWDEVLQHEQAGLFKKYKTIIIDTAKAALDDFLMAYVVRMDFKNAKNKLQAYGAIGEEFKRFVNARRDDGVDIIIIAHAKKDEDTKKMLPDITGQSYNLMLRVADQVGFVSMKNNKATIQWSPSDVTVGKNTASLGEMVIPEKADPAFKTFMAEIIAEVKKSIVEQSEEERAAVEECNKFNDQISKAEGFETLKGILSSVSELPKALQAQLITSLHSRGKALTETVTTVDGLNEALGFFMIKPMSPTKDVQAVIKPIQEKNGWKFNNDEKKFFAPDPAPSDDLKKEIPGPSINDPKEEKQELAFS